MDVGVGVGVGGGESVAVMCTDGGHGPFEDIMSEGGSKLGEICRGCGKVLPRCRVCRKIFKRLSAHLMFSECGMYDKAGLWWGVTRPATAERFEKGMNRDR